MLVMSLASSSARLSAASTRGSDVGAPGQGQNAHLPTAIADGLRVRVLPHLGCPEDGLHALFLFLPLPHCC